MQPPEMLKSGLDWNIVYFLAQLQKAMISSELVWLISLDLLVAVCTPLSVLLLSLSDTQFHIEPRPLLLRPALFCALPFSRQHSALGEQLVTSCVLGATAAQNCDNIAKISPLQGIFVPPHPPTFFNQCTDSHLLNVSVLLRKP